VSEFVFAPCANLDCEVAFASGIYCSICEEKK
jgi:hypothetical protein